MDIDRDVIIDLLPLYRSGLASAPTRRLVEEWCRAHGMDPGGEFEEGGSDDDAGLEALLRARTLLRWQRRLYGLAIGFSVLTCTSEFHFEQGRLVSARMLAFAYPVLFAPVAIGALACWAGYFWTKAKMR